MEYVEKSISFNRKCRPGYDFDLRNKFFFYIIYINIDNPAIDLKAVLA